MPDIFCVSRGFLEGREKIFKALHLGDFSVLPIKRKLSCRVLTEDKTHSMPLSPVPIVSFHGVRTRILEFFYFFFLGATIDKSKREHLTIMALLAYLVGIKAAFLLCYHFITLGTVIWLKRCLKLFE